MNNGEIKDLCAGLLNAETEDEVTTLLKKVGFWEEPAVWRHYGDVENNWGQGGNQQSLAEAALVEKIVNAVDARLINECLERRINPRESDAPKSIREAVSRFFEGGTGDRMSIGGFVEEWTAEKIREVAQGITLCGTGTRPILNLTISDCGEGQTPRKLPTTIMSLNKSNKMYIPFVQGQFNQGGTGALRFCGRNNLQLVISRRNPRLLEADPDEDDSHWGFTLVRRERPIGGRRNSIYTYLAPVGVGSAHAERKGEVLSFSAPSLNIFSDKESPYGRETTYGTAVKLFEYKYLGERSNIIRGRSILSRLDLLLPEIALPVRVYEFRKRENGTYIDPGSRETTLSGLRRRLGNTPNVEKGFPIRIPFSPAGEQLFATVYAFKPAGTARDGDDGDDGEANGRMKLGGLTRYRKREGVLFVRNGQTQGTLPKDFFRRESMKLKTIADDVFVFVECDQMTDDVREDLFMPSRDRLTDNDFKRELIDGLEQALRGDSTLRKLRNERQLERMSDRMRDDQPLADVLQQLIRTSPNLTALLRLGQRITAPFNTNPASAQEEKPFKGEVYPSFFKIRNVPYGEMHKRECPINYRMRLPFETDARDDYFTRRIEGGKFALTWVDAAGSEHKASIVGPNLRQGAASVMATLPDDVEVGQVIAFIARTEDTRNRFENRITVTIRPPAEHRDGGTKPRKDRKAIDKTSGKDREKPRELATPTIVPVYRNEWLEQKPPFDEYTGMRMDVEYDAAENEIPIFRINMDNTPLLNEISQRRLEDIPARNQFMYGNVLVGLSILLEDRENNDKNDLPDDDGKRLKVEDRVEMTCRGLAPFMLSLTSLGLEDLSYADPIDGLESATG